HHRRHVIEQIDSAADVLHCIKIVRRILAHELDVVEHPRVANQFDDRWPGDMEVRAETRLVRLQQLTESISAHWQVPFSWDRGAFTGSGCVDCKLPHSGDQKEFVGYSSRNTSP